MRGVLPLLLLLLAARSAAALDCKAELKVQSARATYKLAMFKGKPVRRDGSIEVELASSATSAVGWVELGVFLGASLKAVNETRPQALPTARPRDLEDGGVAFRAEVTTLIAPGSTRRVVIEKSALPMDRDLSSVAALVSDCRVLESVGAEVRLATEAPREEPRRVVLLSAAGALLLLVLVLWRLR